MTFNLIEKELVYSAYNPAFINALTCCIREVGLKEVLIAFPAEEKIPSFVFLPYSADTGVLNSVDKFIAEWFYDTGIDAITEVSIAYTEPEIQPEYFYKVTASGEIYEVIV